MYKRLMVPVDLAHAEKLEKALQTAAGLARDTGAEIVYVGVTSSVPSAAAHTPQEYAARLQDFAAKQGAAHAVGTSAHVITSHDPSIDLAEKLIAAIRETGSDVVVMASHVPGMAEHVFASNAGHVASHAPVSVFVVR